MAAGTGWLGVLTKLIWDKPNRTEVDNVYESIMARQDESDKKIMASLAKQEGKMDTVIDTLHNTQIKVAKLEAKQ